ncbi:dihydroorotase [uncultured Culturomica sp.]|uniref:dihydroorotase n=1 Tax=uncultured Culturomica sp. TaxID=1926654 RepID=UPI000339707F|nr:dihydroorotase [uncultured Culturomica sp.]CCZ09029.1 dihydroorotase multifunctional complex type [Odoribacter sp. CAG:788]
MKKIIKGGTLVNENRIFQADILIENDRISCISDRLSEEAWENAEITDATGLFVIPGVIDDQVHFREPGLTHKGDIAEGSRAAAAGGVTSFMDMPNVVPPTTTLKRLEEKQEIARRNSAVNYSFYLGATSDNMDEIRNIDPHTTCGLKVFMGSSTGNMLVDKLESLEKIFSESPVLIATHCEDTPIINRNLALYKEQYGDDIPAGYHPLIRSREACYKSSSLAAALARKHNSRLHILHLSTAEEIALLDTGSRKNKKITGEVCVHHLWFNDSAYLKKGNLVKWNPAIKTEKDRQALIQALNENRMDVIATDHAPHTLAEKSGPYTKAASGGPMVQHSLTVMLQLMEQGEIRLENIVDKMCHAPAELFRIKDRGYLREGYKADICLFGKRPWQVTKENILYRCGWSPLEGMTFDYKIQTTFVNGHKVYENGKFDDNYRGEMLEFC